MDEKEQCKVQLVDGIPFLEVKGDIDIRNADQFEAALGPAAAYDRGTVVISLLHATYFDSRTVHVLLAFADRMDHNRQKVMLVLPAALPARRMLQVTGLLRAIQSFETLEEALKTAGGSEPR